MCLCRWRDYALPARINRRHPLGESGQERTDLPETPRRLCSVVIPCHDGAAALAENLPILLEQDFPAERYEVIVVDDASTDDTADVLKRLENRYPHLRHTFVPPTARFVVRRKLAITLGIRAARSPWVLITLPECRPVGKEWLRTMIRNFTDEVDFVQGYSTFINDGSRRTRRAILENLQYRLMNFRATVRGRAIGGDICNMGLRKSLFLEKRGFADSLTLGFGEGDLLADALAERNRTRLELHPEAMMRRPLPEADALRTERICRRRVIRNLSLRGRLYHFRNAVATWAMHMMMLAVAIRLYLLAGQPDSFARYELHCLYYDLPLLLLTVAALVIPIVLLRKGTGSMGERRYGLMLPWYALAQPWRNGWYRFLAWCHRRDFTRKI